MMIVFGLVVRMVKLTELGQSVLFEMFVESNIQYFQEKLFYGFEKNLAQPS